MDYRKRWGLFIDDVRDLEYIDTSHTSEWHIARTSDEAIRIVKRHGLPTFISFDYDLGAADTSMRFLRWLENETAFIDICPPPKYLIHSGHQNNSRIIELMEDWAYLHKQKNAFK